MANNKHHNKNTIYTRNIDPIQVNTRLSNIVLFDNKEEEIDLHMIKSLKLCISIPTLNNRAFTNEISKLDILLKDYEQVAFFLITNEPVFTQTRMSKPFKLERFNIISDFKKREYARATGTYIYELGQLVKSVFLIDRNDKVVYVKYYDDLYSNIDFNELAQAIKEAQDQ
ncbi:MAG: hypothetical protein PHQ89_04480 [Bacilli bacterium]|nr:hypothetical protein [Bacilli bacterium]